jgi:hypothetical protein
MSAVRIVVAALLVGVPISSTACGGSKDSGEGKVEQTDGRAAPKKTTPTPPPRGPVLRVFANADKQPVHPNIDLALAPPGTPITVHDHDHEAWSGASLYGEDGPLGLALQTSPNATVSIGDTRATADSSGRATMELPLESLLPRAALHPKIPFRQIPYPGGTQDAPFWMVTLPVTIEDAGATHELELKVVLQEWLNVTWGSAHRAGSRPAVLPGDPDPTGPRRAAMFALPPSYVDAGPLPGTVYDVDVIVTSSDDSDEPVVKKCGPYGQDERDFVDMVRNDMTLTAWDTRTGKKLGTKTIRATAQKCPEEIWAGSTQTSTSADMLLINRADDVVTWVTGYLE